MASLKVKSGPPLRAVNSWPSSSKSTVMTMPAGRGPASPKWLTFKIREFSKTEV